MPSSATSPEPVEPAPVGRDHGLVAALVAIVTSAASVAVALSASSAWTQAVAEPRAVLWFLALTVLLQLFSVEVYGRGAISVAGVGLLAAGMAFGAPLAMALAVPAALAHAIRYRVRLHRALFNIGTYALSAGGAAAAYHLLVGPSTGLGARLGPALVAAAVFAATNLGLLVTAMSLSEGVSLFSVWNERFRWFTGYYLAYGPLALACVVAHRELGATGLVAFALPPALFMLSIRQYLLRTRESVEEVRRANAELKAKNDELGALVEEVKRSHRATIAALSRSMEAKDDYTGEHTDRVAELAVALAGRLGYGGEDLEAIEIGALLHDIGKIGVPEDILRKPGPLTRGEWHVMRRHPVISERILADAEVHPIALAIARWSHERIDGAGYPDGLAGDEIPLPARIVLVADAFDALTSDRPYRVGRSTEAALEELRAHAGTQFCPRVLRALDELVVEQPLLLGGPTLVRVA